MMHRLFATVVLALCATASQAAVSIDLNLTVLRGLPEAATVQARIDAVLPDAVKSRLAMLKAIGGFDLRKDLSRAVIDIPDQGMPSARVVGVPPELLNKLFGRIEGRETTPGGLTIFLPPRRPEIALAPLADGVVMIGQRAQMLATAQIPAGLSPVSDYAVVAHVIPGAQPRLEAMKLVADAEVRATGDGRVSATIHVKDETAAIELVRRLGVIKELVASGAAQGLPELTERSAILSSLTIERHEATLECTITVPPAIRAKFIEQALQRIEQRLHKVG